MEASRNEHLEQYCSAVLRRWVEEADCLDKRARNREPTLFWDGPIMPSIFPIGFQHSPVT